MRHLFFALFDDETSASTALDELRRVDRRRLLNISVHKRGLRGQAHQLTGDETDALENGLRGILIGAAGGLVLALILSAAHVIVWIVPALLLATAAGAGMGALGGMLYGEGAPDRKLERAVKAGEIVVSIDAPDLTVEEMAERITIRHGARVERKPLLS
jgi:hypothetical protein